MAKPNQRGTRSPQVTRRVLLRGALGAAAWSVVGAACQPAAGPPAPPPAKPAAGPPAAPANPASAPAPSVALARRRSLTVAWTSPAITQAPLWMAHETGAWQELGIDTEMVRLMSSSRMAASMQAGEVDGGVLDWAVAFQFVAQGGNARLVAAINNRQTFSVMSVPSITRPQDVVGKRWGITRIGSSAHTATLLALEMWGLRVEDVNLIQLQEVPAILAAMHAGQVDVGVLSPPTNTRGVQAGLRKLVDLGTAGPDYPSIALSIVDRHVAESPDLVRAYVAGYGIAVARFVKDRERTLEVLRKYLQLDDTAILDDARDRFVRSLPFPPTLPMASLPRVKEDLGEEDPRVAGVAITDVAVPRFVDELVAEGYFAGLL